MCTAEFTAQYANSFTPEPLVAAPTICFNITHFACIPEQVSLYLYVSYDSGNKQRQFPATPYKRCVSATHTQLPPRGRQQIYMHELILV
jgi:hypothetical protein